MRHKRDNKTAYGILLFIIAHLSFAAAWIIIKSTNAKFPVFEIIAFRSVIGTAITVPLLMHNKKSLLGINKKLLYLRALLGLTALALVFKAITNGEIGTTAALLNTSPIFVILLAPFILGERFRKDTLVWITLAFIGIILILKIGFITPSIYSLMALAAGIITSLTALCIKKLQATDHPLTIAFYFMWTTAIVSIPFCISNFVIPTLYEAILLITMGVFVAIGQILATYAYKFADASTIIPFRYSFVLFTYIGGIAVLGETPDTISLVGSGLIIVSGLAISHRATARKIVPTPRLTTT